MRTRLKEYRLAHQKRQADIAQALGVSSNYYAMIERGERSLNDKKMQALADYYNVSIGHLIDRSENRPTVNAAVSLVHAIAEDEEFPPAALEILRQIAQMPPERINELSRFAAFINTSQVPRKTVVFRPWGPITAIA